MKHFLRHYCGTLFWDTLEDENVAETLRTKDNEKSGDINKLVGELTETIGGHK